MFAASLVRAAGLVAWCGAPPAAAPPNPAPSAVAGSAPASSEMLARLQDALAHDGAYKVRLQAAVLLGRSRDGHAVDPLLSALSTDSEAAVRAAAATGLGALGDLRAVAPLMQRLALDKDAFVRDAAGAALGQFPRDRALPHVMATYGSEEPAVRRQVLLYLRAEAGAVMEPVLTAALGDSPEVFEASAAALGRLPVAEAVRILEAASEHRDPAVRRGAVQVLRRVADAAAARVILAVYERDVEVDEVLGQARTGLRELRHFLPLAQIVAEATGGERKVRARAIKLLGVVGGDAAAAPLLHALQADDAYIRGTAVLALSELGDPAHIAAVEHLARDPANGRIMHLIEHTLAHLRRSP